MIRRKRTAILIEEESFLKITLRRHESLAQCKECGEQVKIITLEEAAEIVRMAPRAIYDLIERKVIHVAEFDDGWLAICLKSLLKET
jgi:predicted HTH domain antitoxin